MGNLHSVVWTDDGFLHPPETLAHEFVDVDDFVRFPMVGLTKLVQFSRVLVDDVPHAVLGEGGHPFRGLLETAMRLRFGLASVCFITSAVPGSVVVDGRELRETDAAAVAVTQYRCAWDETNEIAVRDQVHAFTVTVAYSEPWYTASVKAATGPGS